ncbi:MAG: GTP 3',8-cyclase MoaA [Chloroflexi bacterium]|nr:GTP 3',8-cyclase MoaA [Chloroflexota bacterium]MQC26397.1 GTP 3',8-cyclase MoaA [Chloroflexota bacterium]
MQPLDTLNRPLHDLRISVTDRCNFRCTYCMPKEVFGRDYQFLPHEDLLSFEEIARAARLFVALGVSKVRLTGGEPLMRRELEILVEMLAEIPGVDDLAITTNGSFPLRRIQTLKEAGLKRMSVSLDALDDPTFKRMNDVDFPVQQVLDWVEASAEAGLSPVKINMVVKRGVNEHAILPMAHFFREKGHILRLIEYMDVGSSNGWRLDDVVSAREIRDRIHAELPIEPLEANYRGEVANRYRYVDGSGELGIIASVSQPFCGDCSRARISADGKLYTCLFAIAGTSLRDPMRSGASDEELIELLAAVWQKREDRYSELRSAQTRELPKVEMSYIGG